MRRFRPSSHAVVYAIALVGLTLATSLWRWSPSPALAATGINKAVNFQGKLTNSNGTNITNGTYNMRFRLYDASAAGTLIWTEDRLVVNTQGVSVTDGIFQVNLGEVCTLAGSTCIGNVNSAVNFNTDNLYLTIALGNTSSVATFALASPDPEMSPRIRFTAAPYAMNADNLGGIASTGYVQLGQGTVQSVTTATAAVAINQTSTGDLLRLQANGTDAVNISSTGNFLFGNNADKTISVTTTATNAAGKALTVSAGAGGTGASANAGGTLTVIGGAGGGTNGTGGNVVLQGGAKNGTGTEGSVIVKPQTDNTLAFQVQNAAGTALVSVDTTSALTTLRGASSDATLGSELATSTVCTGTGWTGTGPWTHTTGTTALSCSLPASVTSGATYQVSFATTAPNTWDPARSFTVTLGGTTSAAVQANATVAVVITTVGTTGLTFNPTSTFDGTVNTISVKQITAPSSPVLAVKNSTPTTTLEVRSSGSTTNSFVGLSAGQNNTSLGLNNTALGSGSLVKNTTGDDNVAVGYQALTAGTGSKNVAIGSLALQANIVGSDNVAVGYQALNAATSTGANTAVGSGALALSTLGASNSAFGYLAMNSGTSGSWNTAFGAQALLQSTSDSNSAFGFAALNGVTSGYSNTSVGTNSGQAIGAGFNNLFLGYAAGSSDGTFATSAGVSDSAAIGYFAQVQGSDSISLGRSDLTTLKVAIGNPVPQNFFGAGALQYNTGTICQSNSGSSCAGVTGTQIFGTGTTFTAAMVGSQIVFADGTSDTIASFVSATNITVTTSRIHASSAYRIFYQGLQVKNDGTVYTQGNSATQLSVKNGATVSYLNVDTTGTGSSLTVVNNSTGGGQSISLSNTAGTQTAGLSIDRNGTGGTTTSLLSLSNTQGTTTNGIIFTGTIGTDINTAAGSGAGAGRTLTLGAGQGGATGAGGAVTVTGGAGGATSGAGGAVTIQGGSATAGASNGGGVSILGGASTTTGVAAPITVTAGAGVAASNTAGGTLTVTSGAGGGTAAGGLLTVQGGVGGATGIGGSVTVQAGAGGATSGAGGAVSILGGNATAGVSNGGNLTLSGGAKATTGTSGSVIIKPQAANDSTTAFQIQNAAGTTTLLTADTTNNRLTVGTDPTSVQVWSKPITSGGTARRAHTTVVYGTKMYAWGGTTTGTTGLNTLDIYDYTTKTWSTGTAGGTARFNHSAVVFGGKMYAWGGTSNGTVAINTVDIYDFVAGTWTTGLAGGTARWHHTAVAHGSKMYAWGGTTNGTTFLNTLDIYDFTTNTWAAGTAGGTARHSHGAVVYGTKMYAWGGMINSTTDTNTTDIYDITAGTWSVGVAGGTARDGLTLVVYGTKMYGWGGGAFGLYPQTMDIFDFTTNAWAVGSGRNGRSAPVEHTSVVYNGRMYVWGGAGAAVTGAYNAMTVFDFATGTWPNTDTGGFARQSAGIATKGSLMYAWGGYDFAASNTMDIYDSATNTWTAGTTGGTARYSHSQVIVGNKLYAWGGTTNGTTIALNTMDIYDLGTKTWSVGTTGGTARYGHATAVYGNKMYVWGGHNGTTVINTVDIFDFGTNTWTTGLAGGTARVYMASAVYANKFYIWGGTSTGTNTITTLDIYDIATNTWSVGTAGGTGRMDVTAVVYGSKMYIWGGSTNGTNVINTVDMYDFAAGTWSTGTAGGTARYAYGAWIFGSKYYVWGGWDGTDSNNFLDILDVASTTPTLLVLGTSSADVVGVNGGIYFNNASRSLRCYSADSGWGECVNLAQAFGNNAVLQGGNSFGTTMTIGTNDTNGIAFQTSNTTVATLSSSGQAVFKNATDSTTSFQIQNAAGANIVNLNNTVSRNLAMEGNFEGTVPSSSYWFAFGTGPTLAVNTSNKQFGSQSLGVTTTATLNTGAEYFAAFQTNTTYTFSVYAAVTTGSLATAFDLGTTINGVATACSTGNTLTTTMTRFSCTITTGATVDTVNDLIWFRKSTAATPVILLDGFQLEYGSTATAYIDPASNNFVMNPSFEQGLNGWSVKGTATISLEDRIFNSGSHALKITTGTAANNGASTPVKFTPGLVYSLSLWARKDTGSAASFNIGHTDNGTDVDCLTNQTFTTTWTQFTCTFGVGNTINATPGIYIKQTDTATDTIYIDGVTLVYGTTPQAYTQGGALQVDSFNNSVTLNGVNSPEPGPWSQTTSIANGAITGRAWTSLTYGNNGYVYVVGGYDGTTRYSTSYYAPVNGDGTIGAWTAGSALPGAVPRAAHSTLAINGYLYVFGGVDNTPARVNTIYYAKINSDGSLGAFATSASTLPSILSDFNAYYYAGYVYILGGMTNATTFTANTYYAKVNNDGTFGTFTAGTALPAARATFGQVTQANGYLYIVGGLTTGSVVTGTVWSVKINENGSLGTWITSATSPATTNFPGVVRYGHAFVANGYLYQVTGDNGPSMTNNVYYSKLNANGTNGSWQMAYYTLPVFLDNQSGAYINGYIYEAGGFYGSYSTEVYVSSLSRLKVGGALDLVGPGGQSLINNGAGQLTAGDTTIAGILNVTGAAEFRQSVYIDDDLVVRGAIALQSATNTARAFTIQNATGTTILTADTSGSVVVIGSATSDATQVLLQPDSFSTYADTATCNSTTNQGAIYFNTNANSLGLRTCANGGWMDLTSTEVLGSILFGVVPDSGANPGDIAGVTGAVNGPCKVAVGSATTIISWTACTAYSGGRKVVVTAGTLTLTNAVAGQFQHLCLTGTNNQPALSTAGTEVANLGTVSMPSVTAPIVCLADIKFGGASNNLNVAGSVVYDTRVFTNTQKVYASVGTTAPGLGWMVVSSATRGVGVPNTTLNATNIKGVVVATTGAAATTTINAIIAVSGPVATKTITGTNTVNDYVHTSATTGYGVTNGTGNTTIYSILGRALTPWSGGTACAINSDACAGSVVTDIMIR